jgi:PKHD-type hydroxylase
MMLLKIPNVLTAEQVRECRALMEQAQWIDGKVTAGYQSAQAKNNIQLPEDSDAAHRMGDMIMAALSQNLLFMSAALPLKIFPPLFNCYQGGHSFGTHVDNAIRPVKGTPHKVRTDLSAT